MSGNGAMTGKVTIVRARRIIPQDRLRAPDAWAVVAVGTTARGAVVCRAGTASLPTPGTTLVSGLPFPSSEICEL